MSAVSQSDCLGKCFVELLNLANENDADPYVQFFVGKCYMFGRGVNRNDVEAARFLRVAASRQLAEAQFNLGILHMLGRGVEQNDEKAVQMLQLAADQQFARAEYFLGMAIDHGLDGVQQDSDLASHYIDRAANRGFSGLNAMYQRDEPWVDPRNHKKNNPYWEALNRFEPAPHG